ncbi:MAG: hypothetical protein R3C01_04675 [Planctomycetaceae bacterium]
MPDQTRAPRTVTAAKGLPGEVIDRRQRGATTAKTLAEVAANQKSATKIVTAFGPRVGGVPVVRRDHRSVCIANRLPTSDLKTGEA